MKMKTSDAGISLIKRFEGCRLKAYKAVPSERYYTIGYGHYGKDVARDGVITEEEAEWLLKRDLEKSETAVNNIITDTFRLTQCQFDALVSFTYNCGAGNLNKLTRGRTTEEVANAIVRYNKAGGKVLKGLVRRREEEQSLFLQDGLWCNSCGKMCKCLSSQCDRRS